MEIEQMSLIEVARMLMEKKRTPQNIRKLIKEVFEIKGISDDDYDKLTQLYIDITTSADFVYCGEDNWDLKERQPIEFWERDGASFNNGVEEDDEDDGLTVDDYNLDEPKALDDDEDEDEIEDEELIEDEIIIDDEILDDDDDDLVIDDEIIVDPEVVEDDDYMDEDEYNEIMDDYEDMYDK